MKRSIRAIALLFALCLCLSLFSGCGKSGNNPDDALSTGTVKFVNEEGKSVYRIVRSVDMAEYYKEPCLKIIDKLKELYSVSPKNTSDASKADGTPEIIVGETTRPETASAKALLDAETSGKADEYIICTVGENSSIVIYGNSVDATIAAVDYFVATYIPQETIEGGIRYINKSTATHEIVTIFGISRLSDIDIVRPIYNVSYITQSETDKLAAYLLENTGYQVDIVNDQVASNEGKSNDGSGTLTPSTAGKYEIIIGNCVRDGVKAITNDDAFEIRVEDNKIFLNGGSTYATAMAVTEFMSIVTTKKAVTKEDSVLNGSYAACIGKYDGKTYYRCTWKDDFEGAEINTSLWDIRWDEKCYDALNNKIAYRGSRKHKNNYVEDGKLYFSGFQTEEAYYGGLLTTQGMMEYYMGYIELSTIHPRGDGFWVALYTMSAVSDDDKKNVGYTLDPERVYYNETDVEECYGGGNWAYGNTFAWPTAYGKKELGSQLKTLHVNNRIVSKDDRGFWMDFHTFGFELADPTKISYTCDGNVWCEQILSEGAEQYAYDQSVFIRVAMAVGSKSHGKLTDDEDDWNLYNKYVVDYVQVFQHAGDIMYTKKLTDLNWKKTVIQ